MTDLEHGMNFILQLLQDTGPGIGSQVLSYQYRFNANIVGLDTKELVESETHEIPL